MSLTIYTAPATEPLTVAEARRQLQLNSSTGEPAPSAPTVALISPAAAGDCDNGAWRLGFTYVTADGETSVGDLSAIVTVTDKTANGKIACTNVAIGGSAVTARNAYAIPPSGSNALYVGQIANNTATTYTVNIAASALGAQAPTTNTTEDPEIVRLIAAVRDRAELATGRALITQTVDLVLDAFPDEAYIEIPRPPLQSITHLKYRDTAGTLQTWAASNYVLKNETATPPVLNPRQSHGILSLAYGISWPSTYGQAGDVTVRFVCGYGTASAVPKLLKQKMLIDLSALYAMRETEPKKEPGGIYWSFRAFPRQRVAA